MAESLVKVFDRVGDVRRAEDMAVVAARAMSALALRQIRIEQGGDAAITVLGHVIGDVERQREAIEEGQPDDIVPISGPGGYEHADFARALEIASYAREVPLVGRIDDFVFEVNCTGGNLPTDGMHVVEQYREHLSAQAVPAVATA